jgi:hypothetical protein
MGKLINTNEYFIAIKILKRKYAEEMIEHGRILFNCAENWSNIKSKGQGDKNEGIFGRLINDKYLNINELKNKYNENLVIKRSNKYVTIKRKDVCRLPLYCYYVLKNLKWKSKYAINENLLKGKATIPNYYINDFYKCNKIFNEKDYNNTKNEDRPTIVIIKEPKLFEEKIIQTLTNNLFIDKNNVLNNYISYRKCNNDIFIDNNHPYELFKKDNCFSYQLEQRFVINDFSVMGKMSKENDNKFTIDIGNMSGYAEVLKDKYYKDDIICEANLITKYI